jgi:hypothetical protein
MRGDGTGGCMLLVGSMNRSVLYLCCFERTLYIEALRAQKRVAEGF